MSSDKYINEDTYQTLQEVSIETQSDYEKATEPLWKEDQNQFKNVQLFVATPVHSEVSIHYTQALIEFQQNHPLLHKGEIYLLLDFLNQKLHIYCLLIQIFTFKANLYFQC